MGGKRLSCSKGLLILCLRYLKILWGLLASLGSAGKVLSSLKQAFMCIITCLIINLTIVTHFLSQSFIPDFQL